MEVRAKKALGQHFLTDQSIARRIVDTLSSADRDVLEIGPGMGVLTQYLLQRDDIDLKAVELDGESVDYLLTHFPGLQG
ncbi:MAG: 16S rRNA (adenine(1518)-N(6)/adenine(1519)-N(6))-dimethyltransferase, partial [Bacteroidales bacterium]|nr:16S rRNA (adenine(1518)-N(6)/adenine(1519)-N(6))-dimethyltransferase [Bacteroidales bacterium]